MLEYKNFRAYLNVCFPKFYTRLQQSWNDSVIQIKWTKTPTKLSSFDYERQLRFLCRTYDKKWHVNEQSRKTRQRSSQASLFIAPDLRRRARKSFCNTEVSLQNLELEKYTTRISPKFHSEIASRFVLEDCFPLSTWVRSGEARHAISWLSLHCSTPMRGKERAQWN